MRSASPTAPPAWIWAASVLVALSVLAATLPAFVAGKAAEARPADVMEQAIARFAREAPPSAKAWRVIAFGNSALGTATLQGSDMAAYAREKGLELDYLRLWRPWCQLHQILPALASAIDAGPDVVMIDSWSLVYSLGRDSAEAYRDFQARGAGDLASGLQRIADQPSLLLDHQAFLFDRWTGSTSGQVRLALDAAPKQRRGRGLRCDRAARRRLRSAVQARYPDDGEEVTVDPLVRQALETLLRRAAARGVRIVFFDIPMAPPIESLPGVRKKRAATRDLLREIVRRGEADYLEFSAQIDDDDTCDLVHYSERGRDRYLPWFVEQLAALRARGAPR